MAVLDEISCSIFHVERRYLEVMHIKWLLLYCHMSLFHAGYAYKVVTSVLSHVILSRRLCI
jgi:hypothetical protein